MQETWVQSLGLEDPLEAGKATHSSVLAWRSKEQLSFNFMAAVTTCSDFGAPQNKVSHCFHCFPIYLHEVMEPDSMILVF